jgi:curved DNA-binding protein CbpA
VDVAQPPPLTGTFRAGELSRLLQELFLTFAEGRLETVVRDIERSVWFEGGQARAVTSSEESEKLGSWLVAAGLLEPSAMAVSLLRQPEGVLFGTMLVLEGLIEADRLEQELEALAVRIVAPLLFAEGEYRFDRSGRLPADAATIEMTTASLVMAAVRALPDEALEGRTAGDGMYVWTSQDALLRFQSANLQPAEAYVVSRVDGTTTVAQLRRMVGLPARQFDRSLLGLVSAGLVELRGERAPRPCEPVEVQLPHPMASPETDLQRFSPEEQHEYETIVRLVDECRHQDYYKRLGVARRATPEEVRHRYLNLARQFHPDRAAEPHLRSLRRDLVEVTSSLREAFETLANPDARARYDSGLAAEGARGPGVARLDARRDQARHELAAANVKRAGELTRCGDPGMAVQLLDQAARFDPKPETLVALARLEFRNPMWVQRALDHLRRAVTLDPGHIDAWLELARFWRSRKQTGRERHCLERVLERDPTNEEARAGLKLLSRRRR